MNARHRIAAAARLVVRDAHAAEDIFQNVALKVFTVRREGLGWLRKHRRESCQFDADIVEMRDREWLADASRSGGDRMDALHGCGGRSRSLHDSLADRWHRHLAPRRCRADGGGQHEDAPGLFVIANDLTKMQIHTAVAEADVGAATEGQKVDFRVDAFPYETFHLLGFLTMTVWRRFTAGVNDAGYACPLNSGLTARARL